MVKTNSGQIIPAEFIRRPNRFLGIARIEQQEVQVFVPNPGRMNELLVPGKQVFLKNKSSPSRKTDYDMIAVEHEGILVSIDSNLPNRFLKSQLHNHAFDFLPKYHTVKSEPSMFDGRFDFLLSGESGDTMIEVKSCTLVFDGHTFFPDAPTKRGTRHMHHLARALDEELVNRAFVIFVIQRPDVSVFSPNDPMDPDFGDALRYAHEKGVDVITMRTALVDWELRYLGIVPIDLDYFV